MKRDGIQFARQWKGYFVFDNFGSGNSVTKAFLYHIVSRTFFGAHLFGEEGKSRTSKKMQRSFLTQHGRYSDSRLSYPLLLHIYIHIHDFLSNYVCTVRYSEHAYLECVRDESRLSPAAKEIMIPPMPSTCTAEGLYILTVSQSVLE